MHENKVTSDDWKAETKARLPKSKIYSLLQKKCEDDPAGTQVLNLVNNATYDAYQRTKTIIRHMGEYTLHDGDHLFRVLSLMERLLSDEQLEKLNVPELMLLILSAFFHDIGMAPDERDVIAWKKIWDTTPQFECDTEESEYKKFQRFSFARPDDLNWVDECLRHGDNTGADRAKDHIVSEYIRTTHAERAREIIKKDWIDKIVYRDTILAVDFARICFSHNEDPLSVLKLDSTYLCGPNLHANFQLVATLLRLADILDFDAKRTPSILFSHLYVRNPVSISEWNKHRAIKAWTISPEIIQFHARCHHPAIEASINAFCDLIDIELGACNNIFSSINKSDRRFSSLAAIRLPLTVNRSKIETEKNIDGEPIYIYKETQFNLSKKQVIDLLMGTKLYGDPEIALRELIQNSIDACLLRQSLEDSWGTDTNYTPKVNIKYCSKEGQDILEVEDNGTGMDQHIIDTYYSKVGSSFYKSSEFYDLKSQSKASFTPTSRFGIGILSCFMVADTLTVDTRRVYGPHESSKPLNLTIEGQESIFWIKPGDRSTPGTTTKLFLRKNENPWKRMNEDKFITSVKEIIPNPPFEIKIETSSHSKSIDSTSFSQVHASALEDRSWEEHDNILKILIKFDNPSKGFVGSAVVAILESHGIPTRKVKITSDTVDINGEPYELSKCINLSANEIEEIATNISIDENGEIDQSDSYTSLNKSISQLSLHGIEVPTSLFPAPWRITQKNQVKLSWPLPIILVVDICGDADLDLNSPRTQIIMSEKWIDFEKRLSFEVCSKIAEAVASDYWKKLKKVLLSDTNNSIFTQSVNEVERNNEI
ncbi:MAG: metal-dependent phosphohydrolase [Candidatus Electrothrix sp. AU1_5]|nr:metal-dependent phosphohydrolase [Candidatus Electrothrix gigas]